jgi:hypothetical protein
MWVLREVVRLVLRIAVAAAAALLTALILTVVSAGSFTSDARIICIALGCMLLAMAGVGRGSNIERFMDQGVTQAAWGTIPGFDALRPHPQDPKLTPGAVFFSSGLVLIVLGVAVFS